MDCLQINNAGSIMSQRDVNAEGLEKSFATNVLGESVWEDRWGGETGTAVKSSFRLLVSPTRSLHSHQEPHSSAGEERRPQSGESATPPPTTAAVVAKAVAIHHPNYMEWIRLRGCLMGQKQPGSERTQQRLLPLFYLMACLFLRR